MADTLSSTRRRFVASGSALAGAALLGRSAVATAKQGEPANPEAVIRVMTGTQLETLDPHLTGTRNTQIATEAIYSGLVTRAIDNTAAPDLATEWELGEDQLTWTFHLNPEAKFSDGTPVTSAAVKFSLERIKDPDVVSNHSRLLTEVERVEAIDDTTVQIITSVPFAPLIDNLSQPGIRILKPEAVEQWGDDYGLNPVGSGPYMLSEWTMGQEASLVPNPHYFGEPPRNGGIVMTSAIEGGARSAALESGQVDIVVNLPPESVDRVSSQDGLEVLIAPSSFLIFYWFDHGRPPFDDVRVRTAANLAIDREAIVSAVLGGLGVPATGPLGTGVIGRAEFEPYPYDPEQAKALLSEAGYPDGCEITMWAPQGRYLKDRQVAEAEQAYLEDAGFVPELRISEWASYTTEIEQTPPVPNMWLIGASIPDAHWALTRNFTTGGNFDNGYSNPEVDNLVATAAQTFDDEERQALYTEAQRIIWEDDYTHLFSHGQQQVIGHKSEVSGIDTLPYEIFYLSRLEKSE